MQQSFDGPVGMILDKDKQMVSMMMNNEPLRNKMEKGRELRASHAMDKERGDGRWILNDSHVTLCCLYRRAVERHEIRCVGCAGTLDGSKLRRHRNCFW